MATVQGLGFRDFGLRFVGLEFLCQGSGFWGFEG